MSSKTQWIVAALGLAGAMTAGTAHAGGNVQWSVSIGVPLPVVVSPAPVYVPAPRVIVPAATVAYPGYPVYGHNPGYHSGHNPYYRGVRSGDRDGDGIPNQLDRVHNPRWDRDGDGIPNRHDRRYTPGWDRDGDGVPNRYDRDSRWDRDGDGIPNRHDRHPGRRG